MYPDFSSDCVVKVNNSVILKEASSKRNRNIQQKIIQKININIVMVSVKLAVINKKTMIAGIHDSRRV